MYIRNVDPLLIWMFCIIISIQKNWIFVQRLTVIVIFLSPDNRKQIVFLHYTKHCFGATSDIFTFEQNMNSVITVSLSASFLTFFYLFRKRQIFFRAIPAAILACLRRYLCKYPFICSLLNPSPFNCNISFFILFYMLVFSCHSNALLWYFYLP